MDGNVRIHKDLRVGGLDAGAGLDGHEALDVNEPARNSILAGKASQLPAVIQAPRVHFAVAENGSVPTTAGHLRDNLVVHVVYISELIGRLEIIPAELPRRVDAPTHQLARRGGGEGRLAEGAPAC